MNEDRTYKILVVEDEALISMRLQKRLGKMGYDVPGVAYSGEEAVEKAGRFRPDLVLMDVMIPGKLDGIEAAKMIKTELNIPVIFLTAFSEDKIIERAKQAEPFGYLLKPFQEREIKAAIEVALYKKEMEEKLRKAHDELEQRVKKRTAELDNALNIIKRSEKELIRQKSSLEKLNRELLDTNVALSVLAENIDKEKENMEKRISQEVSAKIMPIIRGLQKDVYFRKRLADLEMLAHYLNGIVPDSTVDYHLYSSLTEQEMRVAVMIKNGLTSQKIADMLNISLHTVKSHRKNLRKKLDIQKSGVNLGAYLKSKFK
jgi:DNA-binding NarL/FixJ family response regulator